MGQNPRKNKAKKRKINKKSYKKMVFAINNFSAKEDESPSDAKQRLGRMRTQAANLKRASM